MSIAIRRFVNTLAQDLKRAFSWRFVCSVLSIPFLMMIDIIWFLRDSLTAPGYTVYYLFFSTIVFGGMFSRYGSAIACTLPYCAEAGKEYLVGIQPQFAIRSGKKGYLLSKFICAVFSSSICMALGYCLLIGILSIFFPFVGLQVPESGMDFYPYVSDSLEGKVMQHVLIIGLNGFMTGAFYGSVTTAASAYVKDKLVILSLPFIIRFCWVQFYRMIQLGEELRLDTWLFMQTLYVTPSSTILYSALRVAVVFLISFCIFYRKSTRRIQGLESNRIV